MSDQLDPSEVIARFAERADAVRKRNLPAVGGAERRHFIEQAEHDFMDYSLIAAADATLVDGVLTLRVDLRAGSAAAADPADEAAEGAEGAEGDDA